MQNQDWEIKEDSGARKNTILPDRAIAQPGNLGHWRGWHSDTVRLQSSDTVSTTLERNLHDSQKVCLALLLCFICWFESGI